MTIWEWVNLPAERQRKVALVVVDHNDGQPIQDMTREQLIDCVMDYAQQAAHYRDEMVKARSHAIGVRAMLEFKRGTNGEP